MDSAVAGGFSLLSRNARHLLTEGCNIPVGWAGLFGSPIRPAVNPLQPDLLSTSPSALPKVAVAGLKAEQKVISLVEEATGVADLPEIGRAHV